MVPPGYRLQVARVPARVPYPPSLLAAGSLLYLLGCMYRTVPYQVPGTVQ